MNGVEYDKHPIFGLAMPKSCEGVPSEILNPINTWADKNAYEAKAKDLAVQFNKNFEKYAAQASENIRSAAPVI